MAKRCSRSGLSCGPEGTKLGGLGEINVVGTVLGPGWKCGLGKRFGGEGCLD